MARALLLKVNVDDKGNPVLQDMSKNVNKLNKNTIGLGKTLTRVFASAVMLNGLAKFKAAVGASTKEVFEFNKVFKQVEGITGTSGKALLRLKNITLDVSNATEHSTSAISKAILSISKMGFTIEESLAVVPHVANLATASVVELDEATKVAVQTMKSYGLEAQDMEHITNVIQGTVSKTAIGFEDYAESLKFVAPIAKTMNIVLEETSAMIGKLGDIGIKGSIGGTTLKNMFLNIMKPSADVSAVLKNLNVEGKGFNEILRAMNKSGIPISSFLKTFNKRAVAGSLALAQMVDKTDALKKGLIEDAIKASDVADTVRQSWSLQLETLKNVFNNVFTRIGLIIEQSGVGIAIEDITNKFIDLQEWLKNNPEQVVKVARSFAHLTDVLAKVSSEGFKIAIQNMGILTKAMGALVAFGLVSKVSKMTMGFLSLNKAIGGTGGALSAFNPTLKITVGLLTTGVAMLDRWSEAIDKLSKKTADVQIGGLKEKLAALKDFQVEMMVPSKSFTTAAHRAGGEFFPALVKVETQLQKVNRVAELVGKKSGIDPRFFKSFTNIPKQIIGLEKMIAKLKEAGKVTQDIKKGEGFKIPDIALPKKKAEAGGKKDAWDYWNAALEVQKQFSAGFGIGIPEDISKKAFLPQMPAIGATGLSPSGVPDFPGIQQSIRTPKISAVDQTDPSLMAAQISVLNDRHKETIALHDELAVRRSDAMEKFSEFRILAEENTEITKEQMATFTDGLISAAQQGMDIIQSLQDSKFEKDKARINHEMKLVDKKYARELKLVQGNAFRTAIVERKAAKEKQKLKDEQLRLEKEHRQKQKAWAIIDAGINTALAISSALTMKPAPLGVAMAIIVGALGAAQIAAIASSEGYFDGGYTGSGNPSSVAGVVHKEEYVIPHQDVRTLGGAIAVQDMIDSQLDSVSPARGSVTVVIDTFIGTEEFKRELFVDIQKEAQRWQ